MRSVATLLYLLILLITPTMAQPTWSVYFEGCEGSVFAFVIFNDDPELLYGVWHSGDHQGAFAVIDGDVRVIRTSTPRIRVESNRGTVERSVAADRCGAAGSADTLTPGYLLAALDVPGPAAWTCGGNPVVDLSGQVVITPGEAMLWLGESVPVTVLVLSDYVAPEKCAVVGAAPAWYADWHRYTCLAYQGEDRNCPGEVHYH